MQPWGIIRVPTNSHHDVHLSENKMTTQLSSIKMSMSQMMKSCRRRMQNGKSLQQPLCAMKSRCTYQISMSSIKRAGSMDSNQHRHASIKKKIMQHSATKTRCYLFVGFSLGSLLNPISTQTLVKKTIIVCISYQKILI